MRGTGDTGRERPQRGVVTTVESDDAWGVRVELQIADGRTIHAQPWFPGAGPRGDYYEIATGDVALCIPLEGSPSDWYALVGGSNTKTPPPAAATNEVRAIFGTRVEMRAGASAAVEGVVLRPLLDDLHEVLTALQAVVDGLTATPPGTAAQNATILGAMQLAAEAPIVGLAARLTATIDRLDDSRAGAGTIPHCSPVVRAQSVT